MFSLIVNSILLYQKTLSPDHGWFRFFYPNGYCQYYPSCSEYAKQSISQYRLRGVWMAIKRIVRCNPFSNGGIDEVPSLK